MSKVQQGHQTANKSTHPNDGPMAFRLMRIGHHGPIPNNNETVEISNSRHRLLHQIGRSQTSGYHHRKEHTKLCLEKHHLQVWIPRVLVSDNEKQFDNDSFKEFCSQLGIKNHYSSPTHPQANEQVKVTNQSLLKIFKTQLEGEKGTWPEELPSVLWAHRTTARTPTREAPFRLAYKSDAIILAEVELTSSQATEWETTTRAGTMKLCPCSLTWWMRSEQWLNKD